MALAAMLGVALPSAGAGRESRLSQSLSVHAGSAGRRLGGQLSCGVAARQPEFRSLVRYAVSLTSKLLFGVAAAEVLRNDATFAARPERLLHAQISPDRKPY
jgi:hypothetical protein